MHAMHGSYAFSCSLFTVHAIIFCLFLTTFQRVVHCVIRLIAIERSAFLYSNHSGFARDPPMKASCPPRGGWVTGPRLRNAGISDLRDAGLVTYEYEVI